MSSLPGFTDRGTNLGAEMLAGVTTFETSPAVDAEVQAPAAKEATAEA